MKYFVTGIVLFFSSMVLSQNTGIIFGKIVDKEVDNSPLVNADITLKGTSIKASSDMDGMFTFENLKDGNYTIVYSFLGYETQEQNITVDSIKPSMLKLSLGASTFSLDELTALSDTAKKEPVGLSSNNLK